MRKLSWVILVFVCPLLLHGCARTKSVSAKTPQIETINARTAPLIAAKQGRVYHMRDCPYASALENPVGFATVRDAERTGRIPCEFCKPQALKDQSAGQAPLKSE